MFDVAKEKKYDNVHVKPGSLLKKVKNMKFERLFDGFELLLNNIYCNYIVCSMAYIYSIGIYMKDFKRKCVIVGNFHFSELY